MSNSSTPKDKFMPRFPAAAKKNRTLEIVFHGGLGNQLFQLFYAVCVSKEYEISKVIINTSRLGSYDPPRVFELGNLELEQIFSAAIVESASFISYCRIPKVLRKLRGKEIPVRFGRRVIIDGYFQNSVSYKTFHPSVIQECLNSIKISFPSCQEDEMVMENTLHHIRLGDGAFLFNPQEECKFLEQYIKSFSPKYIMSDKEDTVNKIGAKFAKVPITIVNSYGLSAVELLNKMGSFKRIKTNGSTLALWASILYGRDLETSDYLCSTFRDLLVGTKDR